jgi:hypothetical protein
MLILNFIIISFAFMAVSEPKDYSKYNPDNVITIKVIEKTDLDTFEPVSGANITRIDTGEKYLPTDDRGETKLPLSDKRYRVKIEGPKNNGKLYIINRPAIPREELIVILEQKENPPLPSECLPISTSETTETITHCYTGCKPVWETRTKSSGNCCEEDIEPVCNTCNKCSVKNSPIYRYFSNQRCNLPPWQQPPLGY